MINSSVLASYQMARFLDMQAVDDIIAARSDEESSVTDSSESVSSDGELSEELPLHLPTASAARRRRISSGSDDPPIEKPNKRLQKKPSSKKRKKSSKSEQSESKKTNKLLATLLERMEKSEKRLKTIEDQVTRGTGTGTPSRKKASRRSRDVPD